MNQANQCAGVCKKSTFYLGTLLIAEKETKKRGPGLSKIIGLPILDIADIVLVSSRPASENNPSPNI